MPPKTTLFALALALWVATGPASVFAQHASKRPKAGRQLRRAPVDRARRPDSAMARRHLSSQLRRGLKIEPHIHFEATVRGSRLLNLAARSGDLPAGLKALGLTGKAELRGEERQLATRMMDLSRNPIDVVYPRISAFKAAAFATDAHFAAWLHASVGYMRRHADVSYPQVRPERLEHILRVARQHDVNLSGIQFLLGVHRTRWLTPKQEQTVRRLLRMYPRHVAGLDLLGEETTPQEAAQIGSLVDLLRESGRPSLILRLHEGEGVNNEESRRAIAGNVNTALSTLRKVFDKAPTDSLQVILAHATHVADPHGATRDLRALGAKGVDVYLNPNPLANLAWGAVTHPEQIDALKLRGARTLVGTDNVGTLRANQQAWSRLRAGDRAYVDRRLGAFRAIAEERRRNPQESASAPPPTVE